jgi:two-component system, NarL family, nitrate/nitrite response regulator NarL
MLQISNSFVLYVSSSLRDTAWDLGDFEMLKIMLIDNNVLFREGLTNLLRREAGIEVIGEAESVYEAMALMRGTEPDVALVDAELPDMDDFSGIRLLRAQQPQMQVVLLGSLTSEDLLMYALRRGARGYILKSQSMSKFMAAIRALERGEAIIPRALVGRLLDEYLRLSNPGEQDELNALTPREIDVLCELSRGQTNRQIATRLCIAENTVKVHVHNILEKLNLRNRRQALRFARLQGMVHAMPPQTLPVLERQAQR